MNNRVINRLTYKSRRNTKMVFEIGFKDDEQVFAIHTYHLMDIDTPNLIDCEILKVFRDVVLIRHSVMLRIESLNHVLNFFSQFNRGELAPNTNYYGLKPASL